MYMRTKEKRNGRMGRRGDVFFLFRRKERSKEKPFGKENICLLAVRRKEGILKGLVP